jgi:hypothetical protein
MAYQPPDCGSVSRARWRCSPASAPSSTCSPGLTNRTLRELISGPIPGYGARQMTYDLRRLRRKGFIQRIPRSPRYQPTSEGRRLAVFFTKTYTRIVNPALAELDPKLPPEIAPRAPLATAWHAFEHALDDKIKQAAIAA